MNNIITIKDKIESAKGQTTGFDYLRIFLSVAVLVWHSIWYSGSTSLDASIVASKFRFIPAGILPLFFALSGFLVTGSLQRTRLYQFVTLRVIRLIPALAVEVVLSAILLGTIFTTYRIKDYLTSNELYSYFLNIIGYIHYSLPGVFDKNPGGPFVNAQLWTIPFELECYVTVIILSILTIIRRKTFYLMTVIAGCLALTVWPIASNPQGRQLVLSFLVASAFYLHRDRIPYSDILGAISAIMTMVLLDTPGDGYLVPLSAAYFVIWLGLKSPPAIPFGDLSYGVFLFHLPIEQTIVNLFPAIRSWWALSLTTLPVAFCVAWLSWNFVEKPILTRKRQILTCIDHVFGILQINMKSIFLKR